MAVGRDDFVIAFRSAFLNKKGKQKFSLLSLILLSIIIIILSNINFKPINLLRVGINEIVYSVSYFVSIPEKKIQKFNNLLSTHLNLFEIYQNTKIELENIRQKELTNNFLQLENQKLRKLIDENISSEEILAKVLIDKDSPFLKSIILNKGSKDSVKAGMGVIDGVYLVGQIIEVNYTNSRALLLSDLNSKIPSILAPQNIQAVISGTGKNFGKIEYTKDDIKDDLKDKDVIIYTSGLGEIFKSGIPIGKISKDNENRVNFFSDFTQLDYVKIVSFKVGDVK